MAQVCAVRKENINISRKTFLLFVLGTNDILYPASCSSITITDKKHVQKEAEMGFH